MSTPAGDDLIGNATVRVDGDTDPALRALRQFSRDADGRLRDLRGRFVAESSLISRSLTSAAGGGDRFGFSLRSLTDIASRLGPVLGRVGLGLGALGAAAGTAAPLLAGIVTTLENIAPAGAVAVTGMLAVVQASAAIKLGMAGVEDAVTAAFDTSEKGAKKFDEALKKLAPNARAFAQQVRDLQPGFQKFQQGVQNTLFTGFADELKRLSTSVLPVVRKNIDTTALTLNRMALGASSAARELAVNGTLGKAMAGANQGLSNLRRIPGQVVTGLGQLAAAGAPAFDRLTAGVASVATNISDKLSAAFRSGALEKAVDAAVDLLKDLAKVAGNVFSILGNIMGPVQDAGGGMIGVLLEITNALKQATATKGFQDAIGALARVMATVARTAGPLLGQALTAIEPIFTTLGPPIERLITNLGGALSPIIKALGPVLAAAAGAVGSLVDAVSPLLPVVGDLIASLLPPLVPLLQSMGDVFKQAAPVVKLLADTLSRALAPVIAQLPAIIQPLAANMSNMARTVFPILARLVVQLAPAFAQMGVALGKVLVAAGPLITAVSELTVSLVTGLMPAITPLIGLVGKLAAVFAGQLAMVVNSVVVPALATVTALLNGDFSKAWDNARALVSGSVATMVRVVTELPGKAFAALGTLAGGLKARAVEAGAALVVTLSGKVGEAVAWVRGLPGRVSAALATLGGSLRDRAAEAGRSLVTVLSGKVAEAVRVVSGLPGRAASSLGDLSGRLFSSGRALVQGLIDGIRSRAGELAGAAKSLLDKVSGLFPHSPAKEGPFSGKGWTLFSGQSIAEALAEGISQRAALVERAARAMAQTAQTAVSVPVVAGVPGGLAGPSLGVGAVRTDRGAGTTTITQTFHFHAEGPIGSQIELENWFVRSLDNVARAGRVPREFRSA